MKEQEVQIKELLTTAEVAALLSVSTRTIYRMTKKDKLKRYVLNGSLFYYKRSEIIAKLEEAPVKVAA